MVQDLEKTVPPAGRGTPAAPDIDPAPLSPENAAAQAAAPKISSPPSSVETVLRQDEQEANDAQPLPERQPAGEVPRPEDAPEETEELSMDEARPAAAAEGSAPCDADAAAPARSGGGLFGILAMAGPLVPLLCVAAMFLPGLGKSGFLPGYARFVPDQARLMDVFASWPAPGSWFFTFAPDGTPLPDVSPLVLYVLSLTRWGWDTLGMTALTGLELTPALLALVGTMLAAGIAVLMLWCAGFAFGGGIRPALSACLVFLSTFAACIMLRVNLPDVLFTAVLLGALLFLYGGYRRDFAPVRLILGYLLVGLAVFAGGSAGLLLPLVACLLFLLWRGAFRRAGALDGAIGFGLMLVMIFGWITILALNPGSRAIFDALIPHELSRWTPVWMLPDKGIYEACVMLLCGLPWLLLILFLPWERIGKLPRAFWQNRQEAPGTGWLWCAIFAALLLAALGWTGAPRLLVPLLALLAIAAGCICLNLSPLRTRILFGVLGVFVLLAAFIFAAAFILPLAQEWLPEAWFNDMPPAVKCVTGLQGLLPLAGVCLFFGILLAWTARSGATPGVCLVVFTLFVTALAAPLNLFTLPALYPPVSAQEQQPPAAHEPQTPETTPPPAAPAPAVPAPDVPAPETPAPDVPVPAEPSVAAPAPTAQKTAPNASAAPETSAAQEKPAAPSPAAPESALPEQVLPEQTLPEPAAPESSLPKPALPEPAVPAPSVPGGASPESVLPHTPAPQQPSPDNPAGVTSL